MTAVDLHILTIILDKLIQLLPFPVLGLMSGVAIGMLRRGYEQLHDDRRGY